MVKNTKGGKSHKKMASKNFKADQRRPKLRKVREEGEDFAVVLKISGGGCLVVQCNSDGKERTCIIRGKFKGRNKRSNQIREGGIILVGLRDWEIVKPGKLPKCDLLEVYQAEQIDEIKKLKEFKLLQEEIQKEEEEGIEFTNDVDDYNWSKVTDDSSVNTNIESLKNDLVDGEFDWDDI